LGYHNAVKQERPEGFLEDVSFEHAESADIGANIGQTGPSTEAIAVAL
jgi:hypothetical protein